MIHFIFSSSLEELRQQFENRLAGQHPVSPRNLLRPDLVIVPNRDISRWLHIRRAAQTGISANLEFVLPANYVHQLNLQVDAKYENGLPDKFRLGWRLYHILREVEHEPEYSFLQNYIYHKGREQTPPREVKLRRFQLSAKIADIYDQYQLFREDWIMAWNKGEQPDKLQNYDMAHWQKQLWEALKSRYPESTDRPALHRRLLEAIRQNDITLPPAVHVFATGAIPPLYIEVLAALGLRTEVFWYRVMVSESETGAPAEDRHPLRLHMGMEHRETQNVVQAACAKLGVERQISYAEQVQKWDSGLLGALQERIRRNEAATDVPPIPEDDRSLRIHACHNPQREVEVLHDNIIEFLETNPDASASDVLVIAPDLSRHVRAIHAVFGIPADDNLRLPYHVHDPSNTLTDRLFELLLSIMMIDRARFRADEVLSVIARQPIRDRFGLSLDDVGLIEHWLRETGIRWGIDAGYRKDDGVFSWEFGLQRMLMGMMQPPEHQEPILDTAPYGEIEGAAPLRVMNALLRIIDQLEKWVRTARREHPPRRWIESITALLKQLLPDDEATAKSLLPIQRAIERLADAGEEEALPLDVVADSLKSHIRGRTAGAGFRKGGVTFSTMVPVRHLPFRFIAVLGLNESTFPGREQASGFDLMQHEYRPGDRQKRIANRALFLDALLTAGQRLHLSYEGFNLRDGQPVPASPVLAELRDVLEPGAELSESRLLIRHRLHGFHKAYMGTQPASPVFTYDPVRPKLLRRLMQDAGEEQHLDRFDAQLPAPGDGSDASTPTEHITLELEELYFFLKHPLRWAVERRVNMRLPRMEEPAAGRDVFKWDALQKYKLRQELLEKLLEADTDSGQEESEQRLRHYFRQKGMLPYRDAGYFSFAEEYSKMREALHQIPEKYRRFRPGAARLESCNMKVNQMNVTLQQRVQVPPGDERIIIEASEAKAKRTMQHWLEHLFSNVVLNPELQTRCISLKKQPKPGDLPYEMKVFEPDQQASEHLQALVATYLNCVELPVPFTPEAMERLHQADAEEDEKKKQKKMAAFRNYFQPASYDMQKYSTLYGDDPYAGLFHKEYRQEFEAPIRELKDRFRAVIKFADAD